MAIPCPPHSGWLVLSSALRIEIFRINKLHISPVQRRSQVSIHHITRMVLIIIINIGQDQIPRIYT